MNIWNETKRKAVTTEEHRNCTNTKRVNEMALKHRHEVKCLPSNMRVCVGGFHLDINRILR